jgi:hypothetical protein
MDLGTMGIPRDVARQNSFANFLFSSDSKIGPGDYNPNSMVTMKKAPVTTFKPEPVIEKPAMQQHS